MSYILVFALGALIGAILSRKETRTKAKDTIKEAFEVEK